MNNSLIHRGPDGEGIKTFSDGNVAVGLGHRRLSIIDIGRGAQPMSNEDGSIWITYNGEIYNHTELRKELEELGHIFRTRCDTECIVHAYEQWGPQCVARFRGMFSFVIWDSPRRQLFAARDRLGVKPFYYAQTSAGFVCASEIKALFACGWIRADLNRDGLPEFMAIGHLANESTLFRGVTKLMPGHYLLCRDGDIELHRYWEIPLPDDSLANRDERELVEEFQSLFRESVKLRLMSDVPLGVFLSGGLDSSAIAATMAQEMTVPVKTFSVGFESQYYSEFDYARQTAIAIGSEHHEVILKPDEALTALPHLIWHEDEPIRFPAAVPLYQVSRLAQAHVKVVLTGEGADELFAGYDRYWATKVNLKWGPWYERLVPSWVRERCVRRALWASNLPSSIKTKISHTFLNHSLRPEEIIFENFYAIFPSHMHPQLFAPAIWDRLRGVDPYLDAVGLYLNRKSNSAMDRLLYADQKSYLVELLKKQDKMSMAASIESRVPFLDHKLVEFAAQVPQQFKLRGRSGKYLVKRAMHQVLPKTILRRKKMGFPIPLGHWFQRGFRGVVRSVLLSDRARDRGVYDGRFVSQLINEHVQGLRNHTDRLWLLLNFEIWARVFIDGDGWPAVTSELTMVNERSNRPTTVSAATHH
jgi:asparagine synthase (glutamine-hydrolysing)